MTLWFAFIAVLLIAAAVGGWPIPGVAHAQGRSAALAAGYHGVYAIWVLVPRFSCSCWAPMQNRLVDQACSRPEGRRSRLRNATTAILDEARQIAHGEMRRASIRNRRRSLRALQEAEARYASIGGIGAILVALGAGGSSCFRKRDRQFRARTAVERWMSGLLFCASLIAIFTTLGIVLSLLFESLRFFKLVPITDFLFGLSWSPQVAIRADQAGSSGAFGSIPLFWGTIFIGAIIAMIVAIPLA
jgi:phosphate transport system permease protein